MNQSAPAGAYYPPGFLACAACQDFGTDVSFSSTAPPGVEHPCRHCKPMRFHAWRLAFAGEGCHVLVDGVESVVVLPPDGSSVVQPCLGDACQHGAVLVRSAAGPDDTRWVEVEHVQFITPWEGA